MPSPLSKIHDVLRFDGFALNLFELELVMDREPLQAHAHMKNRPTNPPRLKNSKAIFFS
jgi:hypothetical protein